MTLGPLDPFKMPAGAGFGPGEESAGILHLVSADLLGSTSVSSLLGVHLPLVSPLSGSASTSQSAVVSYRLGSTLSGSASLNPPLRYAAALNSSLVGQGSLSSTLKRVTLGATTLSGSSSFDSSLNKSSQLLGTSSGVCGTELDLVLYPFPRGVSIGGTTQVADFRGTFLLSGVVSCVSTASGNTPLPLSLSGTAISGATDSVELFREFSIGGSTYGGSTYYANLEASDSSGAAHCVATVLGSLEAVLPVSGASFGGSPAFALLESGNTLTGTSIGGSTSQAQVTKVIPIGATNISGDYYYAQLLQLPRMQGDSYGYTTLTGYLNGTLTASANQVSGSTYQVESNSFATLLGTSTGVCSTTGLLVLAGVVDFSAALTGSSSIQGAAKRVSRLGSSIHGTASLICTPTDRVLLSGVELGGSTASASVANSIPLIGTSEGGSATTSDLELDQFIYGTSAGSTLVEGRLEGSMESSASLTGGSSVSADLQAQYSSRASLECSSWFNVAWVQGVHIKTPQSLRDLSQINRGRSGLGYLSKVDYEHYYRLLWGEDLKKVRGV